MSRIDFKAIARSLDVETSVQAWLPDGKRRGHEWIARNPTRADKTPGSFSINLTTGAWSDFSTSDAGGDLVSLYAYLFHGGDQVRAARELAEQRGISLPEARDRAAGVVPIEDGRPKPIIPVPAGETAPDFEHSQWGHASRVWPYYDAAGSLLLYVCRFDPPDTRKQILPLTWCRDPKGSEGWRWVGITGDTKRPLYGLDRLSAQPDADVIICEGEKAADAAQELLAPQAACIAWLGGTSVAGKVDVRALRGRRVTLWPDADSKRDKTTEELQPLRDQPGVKAMLAIAGLLAGVAASVQMVGYTLDQHPDGWDLADALEDGWSTRDVMAYMAPRVGNPYRIAGEVAEQQPPLIDPDPVITPSTVPTSTPEPPPAAAVSVDDALNPFSWPHLTDKGQPLSTVENVEHMLREYGIRCRYNQVAKRQEIDIPGRSYTRDNAGNCTLSEIVSLASRNRLPKGDLPGYLQVIADRHSYSPVREWIESRPWDGTLRVPALCETIQTSGDPELRNRLLHRWMLSAVAAVMEPNGVQAHGVLVLQGAQGVGKTSWMRRLVPRELNATLDGAMVDPANKDTILTALSHWIVELGELDGTFRKADIARLKAFISQGQDKLRAPYARETSEFARRTVFFGSVNEDRYLVDDTGNRRWWTIPVTTVDYQHGLDMQQVWAEILCDYLAGEPWWLQSDEQAMLTATNADHEAVDPLEELLLQRYNWQLPGKGMELTASEVLIDLGYREPNRAQATQASKVLTRLTGQQPRKSGSRRLFRLPPKASTLGN